MTCIHLSGTDTHLRMQARIDTFCWQSYLVVSHGLSQNGDHVMTSSSLDPAHSASRRMSAHPVAMQRRIGLTGGIATGKSSVGRLLAERHGLPVLDADRYAREALAPGSYEEQAVLEHFGSRVRQPSGNLDRAALGQIVFSDPAERAWLEQLVHPLVRQRFEVELKRLAATPVVVLTGPLLFEAGLQALCSEVWLVDCSEQQQLVRLMGRDGLNEIEAMDRISAQWPLESKRQLADLVIDNQGSATSLAERVKEALEAHSPRRAGRA